MATIKNVSQMYVQCMLKVRNLNEPATAASDCCGRQATAAVVMPSGMRMWRCEDHKTWIDLSTRNGGFVREVIVSDPVPSP